MKRQPDFKYTRYTWANDKDPKKIIDDKDKPSFDQFANNLKIPRHDYGTSLKASH
jgi:hypothetical protein